MLRVVPYYAAPLVPLFVVLSLRVIRERRGAKQAMGSGGQPELERRMRVHANFAEYVPFTLLLLAMAELRGVWEPVLHGLCLLLVAGRCSHTWRVSRTPEVYRFRVAGMSATFTVLIGAVVAILVSPGLH